MKKQRAVRPTRKQKEIIKRHKLEPRNWLVVAESMKELILLNKISKKRRTIKLEQG